MSYAYSSGVLNDGTLQYITGYVHAKTSILKCVLMAQMLIETGGLTSNIWHSCNNPAGITGGTCGGECYGGPCDMAGYATYADAAVGYADNYLGGLYSTVLQVARDGGSYESQCVAIGSSQWAGSHYNIGSGPGSQLIAVIQQNNLTKYDASASLSIPPSGSPGSATSTHPNCTKYGTYAGAGASQDVAADLFVFESTVNGVTIKTAVDQSCQLVGQWVHGAPKPVSVTTPATVFRNIVTTVSQPQNMGIILIGLAIGVAGFYAIDKRNNGEPLFPIRLD